MKTLTIILACLLSNSAMAQKKEKPSIYCDPCDLPSSPDSTLGQAVYPTPAVGKYVFLQVRPNSKITDMIWTKVPKYANEKLWFAVDNTLKVHESDSTGTMKVWIDPKRIVWTSDSTFVLKTK